MTEKVGSMKGLGEKSMRKRGEEKAKLRAAARFRKKEKAQSGPWEENWGATRRPKKSGSNLCLKNLNAGAKRENPRRQRLRWTGRGAGRLARHSTNGAVPEVKRIALGGKDPGPRRGSLLKSSK